MMETVIIIIHVIVAVAIIALVLLQQGKGAEAGASFGGGASQTVFGSSGSASFLVKLTGLIAAILFATSFALAFVAKEKAANIGQAGIPSQEIIETLEQNSELPSANTSEIPSADVPISDTPSNDTPSNDTPAADVPESN